MAVFLREAHLVKRVDYNDKYLPKPQGLQRHPGAARNPGDIVLG